MLRRAGAASLLLSFPLLPLYLSSPLRILSYVTCFHPLFPFLVVHICITNFCSLVCKLFSLFLSIKQAYIFVPFNVYVTFSFIYVTCKHITQPHSWPFRVPFAGCRFLLSHLPRFYSPAFLFFLANSTTRHLPVRIFAAGGELVLSALRTPVGGGECVRVSERGEEGEGEKNERRV